MKLVLMGDFHYPVMEHGTPELLEARQQFFSGMIQAFLQIEADYHISLGDFTNEGFPEEFSFVFEQIRGCKEARQFIHVLGNHDTYNIPKTEILSITGQQRYCRMETEEAVLVFLDTTKEMSPKDYGGEVDPEQMAWLENVLQQSADKPVFMFGHHPLPDTTALSDRNMLRIHPEFDVWSAMQKKSGRGYYFCGHNHVNSIVNRDQWHFVQTAACLDIPAFRMIEYVNGKLFVTMIHIEDKQLLELAALVRVNMKRFKPKAEAAGFDADQALTILHG
ncbi:metallophosphoesterase family protein [Paenibacillus allorhizosphaerae]|uniref:3',5'-cyclic adenosine monophosphate phosphodiesterase CpdA n=1 Tax=Paenibacillus allorhizosphaerae TaxID=2849866 RepID=A0ABM8VDL2_9BACL|nr:metallophosphoesterase [Paenibacillus allorhizosphaerae]CAG7626211.1 3',5'-cyclic adenosine monophosphate phosphodiesterase CpdA [Paenibacillus allorhizosphaerae]